MNYIGSKYSLLNFLEDVINNVTNYKNGENKIFTDLFAGTGVVGSFFKSKGYTVIANDLQYYSYILNKHFIENSDEINTHLLDKLNNLEGKAGFIYNNYCFGSGSGRLYFSDYNGMMCDAIRMEIETLKEKGEITDSEYFFYLASLLNSIDKYANTASVYGAFLKKLKKSAEKKFSLTSLAIIKGEKGKVYNRDANELIREIEGDILYLDPPYNHRQYAANYHLLETIARYDTPTIKGKTGLRDYSNQKSKFCTKSSVENVFEDIIKNAKFKYIFLSYNDEGLMSLESIKNIMEKYGEYKVFTTDYKRFKADNKRNNKKDSTIEYLHCLIKEG